MLKFEDLFENEDDYVTKDYLEDEKIDEQELYEFLENEDFDWDD